MQGYVHSIETFGLVDGPGVRFVIFLQGCNLRCKYCHNPDTWARKPEDAQVYEARDLLKRALRYRPYWGESGGITVSGGEPLVQIDCLLELFTLAKQQGIHTAIDTAGQPFTWQEPFYGKFLKLMKVTDLILLDMKHIEPKMHRMLTGHGNANILDMAKELQRLQKPVWIRHVMVPGWTDDEKSLLRLRDFLASLKNIEKIEVLPYHTLGVYKYQKLGFPEPLPGVPPATMEEKDWAEAILRTALDSSQTERSS